ncbi:hypothetical protein M3182_16350 [Mesobacillus maritimus]|uniref:hypothetical protein n=1 Tax=Mesobacillus maritimus TaxID=1643336 RepID=UPI00203CBD23|nr:hypothetical protein [Mesobacillus maritimus]MCM3587309.1 hypothetical protein [Mesobacillus maritimus]MCM3667875.1 hypothetical protein [Mesobacillus maritimus]
MWVITVYTKNDIQMYEFENQEEAKETFKKLKGNKVLSEVIYYNDFDENLIEEAYLNSKVS